MKIRLPLTLRAEIEKASEANRRSMNAEVVARLEQTFDPTIGSSAFLAQAEAYVRDYGTDYSELKGPQAEPMDALRVRSQLQSLDQAQRQAVAAVLLAALEALGISAPTDEGNKKTNND